MKLFPYILGECGQASTEYVLIIAVVVILAIGAVTGVSGAIGNEVYQEIVDAVKAVVAELP